jgi:hypothetical protein
MRNKFLLLACLFTITIVTSCDEPKDTAEPLVQLDALDGDITQLSNDYAKFYLNIVKKSDGFRPPISARALAYINLTIYEAMVPWFKDHQSISPKIAGLLIPKLEGKDKYHQGVIAAMTYQRAYIFFVQVMTFEDFNQNLAMSGEYLEKYKKEIDAETYERSEKFARALVEATYFYSIEDNQSTTFRNNKPSDYKPPVGEGLWKSTAPDFLNALTPRWGQVRTLLAPVNKTDYTTPIPFSKDLNSAFGKEVLEVYNAVNNMSIHTKWIGEFWSDDLNSYTIDAAGRWIGIASQYCFENKINAEETLTVLAKISIGLHDAAVSCWNEKYTYNLLRPANFINDYMDPKWRSILRDPTKPAGQQIGVTPQHPSYPSGHATFGALAAEILIDTFGDKIIFKDETHAGETFFDGGPRVFFSFTEMAEENAYSRIGLGVHYRMDCVEGLKLGKLVAKRVNTGLWKK